MNKVDEQLTFRLKKTFKLYIRSALQNALSETPSESDVLQTIINIQAALELIGKFFVLRREGWKGIVKSKFHDKSETELLSLIEKDEIQTTPFWKSKDFFSNEIYLNSDDKDLLDKFQSHRNQVMHLGMSTLPHGILNESIWFMVRIINQLEWQDTLPMQDQYLANSLKSLLGNSLYTSLLANSCYIDESIDRAFELYPDDMKHCIQCANESWALTDELDRVCFVCGYRGDQDTFGFADCPLCDAKGEVVFDALNIGYNEHIRGKCCSCREFVNVSKCKTCDWVSPYPQVCNSCA
ncbi:hypothetical protein J8L84_20060 [Alteromonas sp. MMG017]|uniref:hypothetical protein n=1 Tax=Alteromonas sp. MMG017 TaxID=2822692 RepID=UPI001B3A74C2|nr:hypothetical protein [Alteromonas sp. MMG017]MBQ4831576.1 hypothetical protein [Alteromonas sp. MMG017]